MKKEDEYLNNEKTYISFNPTNHGNPISWSYNPGKKKMSAEKGSSDRHQASNRFTTITSILYIT